MFIIDMSGFTLASALAGFSPDSALLIVARARCKAGSAR